MGVESLTIEQLKEKHKDVFDGEADKAVQKVVNLRYRYEGTPDYNRARCPVIISDESYSEKAKKALPILLKKAGF